MLQELKFEAAKGEAKALREVLQHGHQRQSVSEHDQEAQSLRVQLSEWEQRCCRAEEKLKHLGDVEKLEKRCQEAEQRLLAMAATEKRCTEAQEKLRKLEVLQVSTTGVYSRLRLRSSNVDLASWHF